MSGFLYWLGTVASSIVGVVGIRTAEEPKHQVLLKDNNIEIRRYEPMITASVEMKHFGGQNRGDAFRALANYIFGANNNQSKLQMTAPVISSRPQKIQMTAPVMQSSTQEPEMFFVMPSEFTMETLPKPDDERIKIAEQPAKTVAVIRFSGTYNEDNFKENIEKLNAWLAQKPEIKVMGPPQWAGYDPPFTIPALKRNEVMIPIEWTP